MNITEAIKESCIITLNLSNIEMFFYGALSMLGIVIFYHICRIITGNRGDP
jgi:hypothetical protein